MKSQKIDFRVTEADKKALEELARERGMTISQLLRATVFALITTGCVTSHAIGNNQHVINYQGNQYSNASSVSHLTHEKASEICLNYDVVSTDTAINGNQWNSSTVIRCK